MNDTRAEFAKAAMIGLLAQHVTLENESGHESQEPLYCDSEEDADLIRRAVKLADMLIAELANS